MRTQLVKLASYIAPGQLANFAYKQLTSPQVKKLRDFEIEILNKAEKKTLPFKGFDIQTYKWGSGSKSILLIHGWEGQAGNFGNIIEALLKEDYTIYAFDGPSHGFSSKGSTSLFEFVELVELLLNQLKVQILISHSFGGVATTFALSRQSHVSIEKYILLTTPDKFEERINDVANQVGVTQKVVDKLITRFEKEIGEDPFSLNVSSIVKDLNVKQAKIIHDKNDKVIPIHRSQNVANNWPVCEMEPIEGTGHFRILREPFVIDKVMEFIR